MPLLRMLIYSTLMVFIIINSAFSQSAFLNIKMADGSTIQYSINEITKITFDNVTNIDDSRKIGSVLNSFKLLQNYPNPFNPTTTIEYEIPIKGFVEIKIFNVNGKLIKTINREHEIQGNYVAKWDGKNNFGNSVASGLYLYRARFENSIISKRMIFIK